MTINVDLKLHDRIRNAVEAIPKMTLRRLVEDTLLHWVLRLEKKHNKGEPFPDRIGSGRIPSKKKAGKKKKKAGKKKKSGTVPGGK